MKTDLIFPYLKRLNYYKIPLEWHKFHNTLISKLNVKQGNTKLYNPMQNGFIGS